jgi:hypothetical protein
VGEPLRFAFTSRGDPVAGRLWPGRAAGARPLVLVTPALGASQHAAEIETLCEALAEVGLPAATLDLPLQGERASRKLSQRLLAAATAPRRSAADERLWAEFVRQASSDLAAAVAVLGARRELAAERLACVAFEPGAAAAEAWAARDPRVRVLHRLAAPGAAREVACLVRDRLAGA